MKLRFDKKREKFTITETATRAEYHQCKYHLTRYSKNYMFDPRYKMRVWDGKISLFKNGEFAMGLWKEIFKICKINGWKFNIENKNDFPFDRNIQIESLREFCNNFFKDRKTKDGKIFFPYDHQIEAAFKALKNKFCLVEVATGGGKSLLSSLVIFYILKHIKPSAKILIIVPNISLVTQFYNDMVEYNHGKFKENENPLDLRMCEIMSDQPRVDEGECNIFIGTYQSLEKRPKKFFSQFDVVFTDEAHKSGQGSKNSGIKQVKKVIKNTFGKASYRIGMSGTFPKEDTLDWISICELHGPKVAEVRAKELMLKNVISGVKIKSILLNHNNSEFYSSLKQIGKGGNKKAVYDLERKFIHESIQRTDFIVEKIIANAKKNMLVLFNIKDYGKKILEEVQKKTDFETYYIDGDTPKKERERIKKIIDTESDKPRILIASFGTFSTGISLNNLHYVVFTESFKSEQIIIQAIGRVLRLHKDKVDAIVFDVADIIDGRFKDNILYRHYEIRRGFYEEREYTYNEINVNIG